MDEFSDSDEDSMTYFPEKPSKNSWIIAEYKLKNRIVHYVGKIISGDDKSGWEVKFFKKSAKTSKTFIFPDIPDIDVISPKAVVRNLPQPEIKKEDTMFFL